MPNRQTLNALRTISELNKADRHHIANLNLPTADSMVVGYLRVAGKLLERDNSLSVLEREDTWNRWLAAINHILDWALRFRENAALLSALGVLHILLPTAYPHASLRGFKTIEDAMLGAQRRIIVRKQERRIQPRPSSIQRANRISVWQTPDGKLHLRQVENSKQVWAAVFVSPDPEQVLKYAGGVLEISVLHHEIETIAALTPQVD